MEPLQNDGLDKGPNRMSMTYTMQHMPVLHFIVLTLAVYRVTRAICYDEIFNVAREAIWAKFPHKTTYIGYFLTCPWCISMWVALPAMLVYAAFPTTAFLIGCIFAMSAIAGLITARLDQ